MCNNVRQPRRVNPVLGNRFLIEFEDLDISYHSVAEVSEFELISKKHFYFFNKLVWKDLTIKFRDFYEEDVQRKIFDSCRNGNNFNFYYYILHPDGQVFNGWYVTVNKINSVYTEETSYKNDGILKIGANFSIKEVKDLGY